MNMFKKNGGFTLVELIVVIAILAILAGVAVPAYTGYINNANKSSDDTQIAVINQAIEAACAKNGTTADNATCTISGNGVATVKIFVGATNEKDITSDYTTFISGNTITALKYYTSLQWDATNHVVKGVEPA